MENRLHIDKAGSGKKIHAVPRRYLTPILYLADRMASVRSSSTSAKRKMVDELAAEVGANQFRNEPEFRLAGDQKACEMLDFPAAKTAALVVMSLVLKADAERDPAETEFFHKIRTALGADPVSVPADLEEHRKRALEYLKN